MNPRSLVVVRVGDLQPDFQSAVLEAYEDGNWNVSRLQKAVAHEFDFMGPWVDVSVDDASPGKPEASQLTLRFNPPVQRDFADAEKRFGKATRRAERGDVSGAVGDLTDLVAAWPEVAKYWRALGQAHLVLEAWESSEDALLKSLAIDPLDPDSMTLLGNLYARRGKADRAVALYRRSLELDRNVYAMTNVGAMLSKAGQPDEALRVFREAVQLDPAYANAWYGLGLTLANRREVEVLPEAIRSLDQALAVLKERSAAPEVWDASQGLLAQLSSIAAHDCGNRAESMLAAVTEDVSSISAMPVRVEESTLRGILAKIELGWVHGREYHRVLVNHGAGVERVHQIRHELEHARLAALARRARVNKWFASSTESYALASRAIASDLSRLGKLGLSPLDQLEMGRHWIDGINLQLYNFPIDLLIESTLLREHPEFRELWFFAADKQLRVALKIAEDRSLAQSTARIVYRASNTMNGVFALWFEEHFPRRTDIASRFRRIDTFATSKRLYESWRAGADAWVPGAEFGWIDEWASVLGLKGWYVWTDGNN